MAIILKDPNYYKEQKFKGQIYKINVLLYFGVGVMLFLYFVNQFNFIYALGALIIMACVIGLYNIVINYKMFSELQDLLEKK